MICIRVLLVSPPGLFIGPLYRLLAIVFSFMLVFLFIVWGFGVGISAVELLPWLDVFTDFEGFSLPNTDHLADSVWCLNSLWV